MGYNNDPSRDEDGEPLMTFDDEEEEEDPQEDAAAADRNPTFDDDDDVADDDGGWRRQERSPTPVYNDEASKSKKPRKRLVKRGRENDDENEDGDGDVAGGLGLEDDDVAGYAEEEEEDVAVVGKRKKFAAVAEVGGGERRKEKKKVRREKGKGGYSGDEEVKEMWDTVAGADSEDDQNGDRTLDDDSFIDDTGVDPADRYGSDNEPRSPSNAPQAEEGEEDDEIQRLFKQGKKKKKSEKSAGEIALLVENVMAELEVVAEEDAELNKQSKPAINKLIKLPFLIDVLSKKQLQQEFLDHGVLTLLKNWLEPLPDGSLPNMNIREAILRILTDFPIDLDQHDRKEQLKRSGLGKVIMFLSKTNEETTSNRRLAKDLVDKWSRPIFNKSTRFEDMRSYEDERVPSRRPSVKKPMNKAPGMQSRGDDMDLSEYSQGKKSAQSTSRGLTTRPEAMALDFLVRPQSKIDPDEVRARAKQIVQDQRRMKMQKKLTQLKAPKKKQLQATKLSVEGRGMVKYL